MPYVGNQIRQYSDRVVLDSLTASATADYTLQLNSVNFVPSSASALTVSLNGIIQAPISSYTVSGSTLSFSSALTASDTIDFIIAERGITLQTPSAGSVNTTQLASNAVTSAKMFSDFKNGVTMVDQWRITAEVQPSDASFLTSNWERADHTGAGFIGTGLTESSGVFSFPSTGIYQLHCTGYWRIAGGNENRYMGFYPKVTFDNSTYNLIGYNYSSINNDFSGSSRLSSTNFTGIVDVTDTSNVKFKMFVENQGGTAFLGGLSTYTQTGVTVTRLGDT